MFDPNYVSMTPINMVVVINIINIINCNRPCYHRRARVVVLINYHQLQVVVVINCNQLQVVVVVINYHQHHWMWSMMLSVFNYRSIWLLSQRGPTNRVADMINILAQLLLIYPYYLNLQFLIYYNKLSRNNLFSIKL